MPNDLQLTDNQLRLATSRSLPPGAQLDAASSAARDSFLTLGSALESAATNFDEAALRAQLTNSREQICSRSISVHNGWPLVLCGALAASALVAIVRVATVLTPADPQIAVTEPKHFGPIQAWSPAFSDSLDDELAFAAAALRQYGSRERGFDGTLYDINVQLEALSEELSRESL